MSYVFISTPSHGYLQVPIEEIRGLSITTFSFYDNEFAYLEEDCDAYVFTQNKGLTEDVIQVNSDSFPGKHLSRIPFGGLK